MVLTLPERLLARTTPRAALPTLPVAVRLADPDLAARVTARLDAQPDLAVVEEEEAAVLVAEAVPAGAGLPALVLAEGAAAAAALRAGARAVLPPDAPGPDLAAALRAAARGLHVLPPAALDTLLHRDASPSGAALTPREREVLTLLAAGASNKVIARRLTLSFHTAKAHVAAVLAKLGAGSRADAVARGVRAGLVLL